jgi:murein DD-endopeptidase MepM/ murein hydrolase activator NlpD
MDRCFAGSRSRRALRWAVLPALALGAAACSPDTTRFGDIPIGNPFAPPPPGGQMSAPMGEPAMAGGQPPAQPASLQYAAPQTPAPPRLAQPQPPRTAPEATATVRPSPPGTPGTAGNWDWEGGTAIIVGPGETIEGIARKHRVPASAIMAANGIANPAAIMAGQRLVIPRYKVNGSGAKLADAAAPRAGPPPPTHAAQAPGIAVSTLPAAPASPAAPAAAPAAVAQAPVSLAAYAPAAPGAAAAPAVAPATTASIPASTPAWAPVSSAQTLLPVPPVHTVAAGDTLSRIAHQYHVKVSELAVANGLAADTPLKIGEKITVPVKTAPVKGRAVAVAAPAGAHAGVPPGKTASAEPTASVRMVAADPSAGETSGGGSLSIAPEFRWPIRGRVINNFGAKVNGSSNDGIDLAVPEGTPVRAADDGVVAYSGSELKGYGNLVLVRHANGFVTAYANASELMVKRNDQVHKGQVIAKSGQTGTAPAPQLHFEIRKNSAPVDPMQYLPSDKTASAPL